MGKLTGITVIDLTQFLPGPMMTVMMADQGAEVIKVEPQTGDPAREQAPFDNYGDSRHSVWFANLNRGKSSVVLDLKSDHGKSALRDLCCRADVFVERFRPGIMRRLRAGAGLRHQGDDAARSHWHHAREAGPGLSAA